LAFLFIEIPSIVVDRFVELYLESRDFKQADEFASEIRTLAESFSAEQQHRILAGIQTNNQLLYSVTLPSVINALQGNQSYQPCEV
jgi:hypothetical protein